MTHAANSITRSVQLRLETAPGRAQTAVGESLRRIPGVSEVEEKPDGLLSVAYDPSLTSPTQFLNLAQQAGCTASLLG